MSVDMKRYILLRLGFQSVVFTNVKFYFITFQFAKAIEYICMFI